MTRVIPRPLELLLVLLTVALLFGGYRVLADDPSSEPELTFTPFEDDAERPTVTDEEEARALEALVAEPIFQAVTAGNTWTLAESMPNITDHGKDGIALIIELGTPVDSDGPWKDISCRGTRTTELGVPFRGIRSLSALFDGDGRLIKLVPLEAAEVLPPATPYPEPEPCLPGFEDREN